MTDRICIRGCVRRDVHFATCEHSGPSYTGAFPCRGCAPRECRDGSLICDVCFGRMRRLLGDARDLAGRLTALADPTKATPLDQVRVAASATEPPAPVSADILDALGSVRAAEEWAYIDLSTVTNNLETVTYLSALVLDRHPMRDGIRDAWSVQDAVDRWGVERRTEGGEYMEDDEAEEIVTPIPEDGNPFLTRDEAARVAGSARTLRRWVRDGLVTPAGVVIIAGVRTAWYRYTDVIEAREAVAATASATRFKPREEGDG